MCLIDELQAVGRNTDRLRLINERESEPVLDPKPSPPMKDGKRVDISGFGKFEVKERAARKGINPQTKEVIEIAAAKVPGFKASKSCVSAGLCALSSTMRML